MIDNYENGPLKIIFGGESWIWPWIKILIDSLGVTKWKDTTNK